MMVRLKRNNERMMSICLILFTIWLFLVKCNHNNNLFVLQECVDFTWRVSDCEELVGILTGDDVTDLEVWEMQ